jgi:hypothetical protein
MPNNNLHQCAQVYVAIIAVTIVDIVVYIATKSTIGLGIRCSRLKNCC